MAWIIHVLVAGLLLVGGAGCGAARDASGEPAVGVVVDRAPHGSQAAACPPGTLRDGGRCRRQRGIIIDQRQPSPAPSPPPPVPPPVPLPAPLPAPLPPPTPS